MSYYQPRRPRASPLWQIVHATWNDFLAGYEKHYRPAMGPLRSETVAAVQSFYRCGDLTTGFTRYHCPDCGHERLLAFTCKCRHLCPACHQRRTRQVAEWIASHVCLPVPHRQFVFTIPKVLRAIFRKRRRLLNHLFLTAVGCLRDSFRTRLQLPHGRIAAAAGLHTFGDYLVVHPHLHILAGDGLFDQEGRFHCLPGSEDPAPLSELFRVRFLHALHTAKLISDSKLADLLSWKHSGFHVHADPDPVGPRDLKGRQRLAEYLLRAPFSLQKIHWNAATQTVIYRSRRSWHTKRNFEIFPATDFLAAAIEHIPPKSQHTIRYYGLYSNKARGTSRPATAPLIPPPEKKESFAEKEQPPSPETDPLLIPLPPASAQAIKPLWRDLILATWGADPLQCPCCRGTMRRVDTLIHPEKIEFFLRLLGLWEGLINIPPPPDPPFDIESFEPIEPPWQAIKEWIPADADEQGFQWLDAQCSNESPWKPMELPFGDDRILVLDAD